MAEGSRDDRRWLALAARLAARGRHGRAKAEDRVQNPQNHTKKLRFI